MNWEEMEIEKGPKSTDPKTKTGKFTDQKEKVWEDVNHIQPLDIYTAYPNRLFGRAEFEELAYQILLLCQDIDEWRFNEEDLRSLCDVDKDINLCMRYQEFLNTWVEKIPIEGDDRYLRPNPTFIAKYYKNFVIGPIYGIDKMFLNNPNLTFCKLLNVQSEEAEDFSNRVIEIFAEDLDNKYKRNISTHNCIYYDGTIIVNRQNIHQEDKIDLLEGFDKLLSQLRDFGIKMKGKNWERIKKMGIPGQVIVLPDNKERIFVGYDEFELDIEEILKYFNACIVVSADMNAALIRTKKEGILLIDEGEEIGWKVCARELLKEE